MRAALSFLWFTLLVAPVSAQDSNKTTGSCSPIAPNNRGNITIQCSGMSDQLARQLAEILNRIVQRQIDPELVIARLDEISKGVDDLKNRSTAAERGIISIYDFNGAKRVGRAGYTSVEAGQELNTFVEMKKLISQGLLQQLVDLCETQISKTPDWLTPYFFAGAAYADLGQSDKALERLDYVVRHAGGDPQYQKAQEIIAHLKGGQPNAGPRN